MSSTPIPNDYVLYNYNNYKSKDYNKITVSGYKKTEIISALDNSITLNNIEESIYWSSELVASAQFNDKIWEKIFIIYGKHINISNPNMPSFILTEYYKYNNIISKYNSSPTNELEIRNNQLIRNIIANVITQLTLSQNTDFLNTKNLPKISNSDMSMDCIRQRIMASDMNNLYHNNLVHPNDPIEAKIALNEILFHINRISFNDLSRQNTNTRITNSIKKSIFYWIKWLVKAESLMSDKKFIFNSQSHNNAHTNSHTNSQNNNNHDWTMIIWNMIFIKCKIHKNQSLNPFAIRNIKSLYQLFIINYKKSQRNNKIYLLYTALMSLIYHNVIDWKIPTISINDYTIWVTVCANINSVYKKIAQESNCMYDGSQENEDSILTSYSEPEQIPKRNKHQQHNQHHNQQQHNQQYNQYHNQQHNQYHNQQQHNQHHNQQQHNQHHNQHHNHQKHHQNHNQYQEYKNYSSGNNDTNSDNYIKNQLIQQQNYINNIIERDIPNNQEQNYNYPQRYNHPERNNENKSNSKSNSKSDKKNIVCGKGKNKTKNKSKNKNSNTEQEDSEAEMRLKERMRYLYIRPPPPPIKTKKLTTMNYIPPEIKTIILD